MPISGLTAFVSSMTSCPWTRAFPYVGSSTVERILTSVVLPAPFGPSSPWISPCRDLKRDVVERDDVGLPLPALEDARDRLDLDRRRADVPRLPAHGEQSISAAARCTDSVKPCKGLPTLRLASVGVVLRKLLIGVLLALALAAPAAAQPVTLMPGVTYEKGVQFTPHGPSRSTSSPGRGRPASTRSGRCSRTRRSRGPSGHRGAKAALLDRDDGRRQRRPLRRQRPPERRPDPRRHRRQPSVR